MKNTKAYLEGKKAYRLNTPWALNPYKVGTTEWQEWNNGKGDSGDTEFYKEFKKTFSKNVIDIL